MNETLKPRIGIAGDRVIALQIVDYLIEKGDHPVCLLLHSDKSSSHGSEIRNRCPWIPDSHVLYGNEFKSATGIEVLTSLELDFLISVHFHYLFPKALFNIAKHPTLNLHPAFLPYNRGWHTPTWAILDGTPYGATLHVIDEGVDTGDILHQKMVNTCEHDTANSLYQKALQAEFEVFQEAWPQLRTGNMQRVRQTETGTKHLKKELSESGKQGLNLNEHQSVRETLKLLRALTTNDLTESAYFETSEARYHVRVEITEQPKDHLNNEKTVGSLPHVDTASDQELERKLLLTINKILQSNRAQTINSIHPEMRLQQDLRLDSLQLAELTVLLELEFGVDVFANGIAKNCREIIDVLRQV